MSKITQFNIGGGKLATANQPTTSRVTRTRSLSRLPLLLATIMIALFAAKAQAQTTVFSETFDKCSGTGGNDGSFNGNIASNKLSDSSTDNEGWTFSNGYAAKQCVRLGGSSKQGSAETPTLTNLDGDATLTFRAAAWKGDATTLNLSISGGGTLSESSVTLKSGEWDNYTITITGGTSASKVKFQGKQASKARFFLDYVVITSDGGTQTNKFAFSTTTATARIGEDFTVPTLTNTYETTATYSSSNTEVATVDASTGTVTLVAAGETTITASDGTNSASYTLTVEAALSTLDGVKALREEIEANGSTTGKEYSVKFTNAVVTFVPNTGKAIIEQDGIGIMVYYSGHGLTAGQVLNGTVTLTGKQYQGYGEITSSLSGLTITSGEAPEPTVVTVSQLQSDFANYGLRYVKVENATTGSTAITSSNRKGSITDSSSSTELTLRSSLSLTAPADANVNVTGVCELYSSNPQLIFYNQDDLEVLVTLDEDVAYTPVACENATVTLVRTFKGNGTWNTFCVPFSISNEELTAAFGTDVEVAEFSSFSEEAGADFTTMATPAITANTPVLMKTNASAGKYTFSQRTIEEGTTTVSQGDINFVGTYTPSATLYNDAETRYAISANQVHPTSADQATSIKGTRAYLATTATTSSSVKLLIDGADGSATSINGIETASATAPAAIYTLSGQRVGNMAKGGIYIVNGKKVLVK